MSMIGSGQRVNVEKWPTYVLPLYTTFTYSQTPDLVGL